MQDDELYGDFEDLETGEAYNGDDTDAESSDDDEVHAKVVCARLGQRDNAFDIPLPIQKEVDRETKIKEKRLAKKRKMKALFDREYDISQENGKMKTTTGSLFDSVKDEMSEQAKLNRAEFEDMDDAMRVQYEGYR